MTNPAHPKVMKERSKSFPVIPLKVAIERLQQFDRKFGRHPAPYEKSGLAWGMEEGSSQANRVLAALKSFGLLEYNGSGKDRIASITESGRTYLRAQQESIKKEILKAAALKPKQIAHFWPRWGIDRPPNELCLDQLVLHEGFTESSAPQFLKVYDETIAYAGLTSSDNVGLVDESEDEEDVRDLDPPRDNPPPKSPAPGQSTVGLAEGERILTTGLLAKGASFKLIVSGRVGPKEIDILIRKLELDKEILGDPGSD